MEARSVEHMKNVARGLENKIIELQQKLTEKVMFHNWSQCLVTKDQAVMLLADACFLLLYMASCTSSGVTRVFVARRQKQ